MKLALLLYEQVTKRIANINKKYTEENVMNFRNLEYFNTVVEEQSIRAASKKLYISEQSLSESIRRLETELNNQLFIRSRPFSLTEAGRILYSYSKDIISKRDEMIENVSSVVNNNSQNEIKLSIGPMGMPVFLPELIMSFEEKYPKYRITIRQKSYNELNKFSSDEIGFISGENQDKLNFINLFTDRCCVVVSEIQLKKTYGDDWKNILEDARKSSDIYVLGELTFIDWKTDKANCFVECWKALTEMKFTKNIIEISDSFDTNLAVCRQGLGALFSMEDMIRRRIGSDTELEDEHMYLIRLNLPDKEFNVNLFYRKDKVLNEAEKAFIREAKVFFA